MPATDPSTLPATAAYDPIADLYDRAFSDIRVRRAEWQWLSARISSLANTPPHVLDIGCGNGALLTALRSRIQRGVGVDVSSRFIEIARARTRLHTRSANTSLGPELRFETITNATLPFPDNTFDVVTSFLSFRYLQWDAVLREAIRVLRPNGHLLIIDMVAQQASATDAWHLGRSLAQHLLRPLRDRRFHHDVARLTSHPDWLAMLERHPIRDASEYRACLARWFPGRPVHALNVTLNKRVIAFDSGPIRKP